MTRTPGNQTPRSENEEAGRLAGFGAGAYTGARIGSMLIPVPFVGTFAGMLIGGAVGSRIGQRLGTPILDAVTNLINPKPANDASTRASSIPIITPEETTPSADLLAQLERLGKLREQGLLTEDEFTSAKAKLLSP